jgi:hypothetical protein
MHTRGAIWIAGAGVLALAACGGGGEKAPRAAATGSEATPAAAGPKGTATIRGTIKFTGTPPSNPPIDMSEEAKCKAAYATPPRDEIVVVNPNGTLKNVFVHVKAGVPAGATYAPPTSPVVLDQKGCMYHPRVFGVMVGQTLDIRNDDPLLHNIKAMAKRNRPFNISQPTQGMDATRTFAAEEVILPFECNVHGWMRAYAGVLPHPFFSTTGADGTFSIDSLPPGTYTIEAWHEKYGTQTATITVQNDQSTTADFTFAAH